MIGQLLVKRKQWGSYVADDGTKRQNRYAVSFASKVYGIVVSGNLSFSDKTIITNLNYWYTSDTNHGSEYKQGGWYLVYGK